MKTRFVIGIILAIQAIAAAVFLVDLLIPLLGLPIILSWDVHEGIELMAAIGLLLGVGLGTYAARQASQRTRRIEAQLRAASGAFFQLIEERFQDWGLTPAEQDVALFLIKGMTTSEVAELRQTSEGTVKAQTNAIYRKAGVGGRPQLLSLFIEDLMNDALVGPAKASS